MLPGLSIGLPGITCTWLWEKHEGDGKEMNRQTTEERLHQERRARNGEGKEGRAAMHHHSEILETSYSSSMGQPRAGGTCPDQSLVDDAQTLLPECWGHSTESLGLDR
jgi:hypothetical protein